MANQTITVKSSKKAAKALEDRATRAFYSHCSGVPVPIRKMAAIAEYGARVAATEPDDNALGAAMRKFVDQIG